MYAVRNLPLTGILSNDMPTAATSYLMFAAFAMGVAANLTVLSMVRELNHTKGANQRIAYLRWTFPKLQAVLDEHESRFPEGKKVLMFRISMIAGTVFLASALIT